MLILTSRMLAILTLLEAEYPDCISAREIAKRLGSTGRYSLALGGAFITEIEQDLEALEMDDPPRVTHDLKMFGLQYTSGAAQPRCWSLEPLPHETL